VPSIAGSRPTLRLKEEPGVIAKRSSPGKRSSTGSASVEPTVNPRAVVVHAPPTTHTPLCPRQNARFPSTVVS